jgi:hypothetical protein
MSYFFFRGPYKFVPQLRWNAKSRLAFRPLQWQIPR